MVRNDILVDALLTKKNTGTSLQQAAMVIGLGPGFTAGLDVHAVVETERPSFGEGILYWMCVTQFRKPW